MKLVYIAGPYRAKDRNGVAVNIEAARRKAVLLTSIGERHGLFPVTPHLNTAHFEDEKSANSVNDDYWLSGTKALMAKCHAVLLTRPFAATISSGTRDEVLLAFALDIPVYLSMPDLVDDVKYSRLGHKSLNKMENRHTYLNAK